VRGRKELGVKNQARTEWTDDVGKPRKIPADRSEMSINGVGGEEKPELVHAESAVRKLA